MTTAADLFAHQETCADCKPDRPCSRAEILFAEAQARMVARFSPPPPRAFDVIDYHAHERGCARCRPWRPVCRTGCALFEAAAQALDGAPGRMVMA